MLTNPLADKTKLNTVNIKKPSRHPEGFTPTKS